MPLRHAILVAPAISVLCPHCSAELPAPDNGSDMWLPQQLKTHAGPRVCVSCDESFQVQYHDRCDL